MTKAEFAEKMLASKAVGSKAEALRVIDAVAAEIVTCMATGDSIALPNLGTFKVVQRIERKGRDIRTGSEITIPARKAVKFTVAKGLKEAVAESEIN